MSASGLISHTWKFAGTAMSSQILLTSLIFIPKLVLPSLDSAVANPLASLLDVSNIELRTFENNVPDVKTLICEVGGEGRSIRWACSSTESLAPCADWSHVNADDRCVKMVSSSPLPQAVGSLVPSDKVRKLPAGDFIELIIKNQLDGSINTLGERLWNVLGGITPQLKERLHNKVPLKRIECRDKFFSSPANVRLIFEAIKGLTDYYGQFATNVTVAIETNGFVNTSMKPSEWFHNDWQVKQDRNAVIRGLMTRLGCTITIIEPPRNMIQHARDITLVWSDGARFVVRLDHGLSFLVTNSYIPFNFNLPSDNQLKEVLSQKYDVKNKLGTIGTYFYLSAKLSSNSLGGCKCS